MILRKQVFPKRHSWGRGDVRVGEKFHDNIDPVIFQKLHDRFFFEAMDNSFTLEKDSIADIPIADGVV